jgi:hypothetical protein
VWQIASSIILAVAFCTAAWWARGCFLNFMRFKRDELQTVREGMKLSTTTLGTTPEEPKITLTNRIKIERELNGRIREA